MSSMISTQEPAPASASALDRAAAKKRQAVLTLTLLRLGLGLWLVGTAFFAGHLRGALGYSDLACAVVLIVVALLTVREPRGRYLLFPLALWIGLSPFVLYGMTLVSFLNEALIAKTLFFTSVASYEMFEE